jgi:acyl carrier protein
MDVLKSTDPSDANIGLENIDPLDIDMLLEKLERSFYIKFDNTELKQVITFGDLCDLVANKVEGCNTNDCTTQQAFYKIRKAIVETRQYDKEALKTNTCLEELFPYKQRRQQIKKIESILGFKTRILQMKGWLLLLLVSVFLASSVALFFSWPIGFGCMILSVIGFYISNKLGKELNLKTVGQLAEKISREHYNKVRRNPTTVNRTEITQKIKELFKEDLELEDSALTRDARFS